MEYNKKFIILGNMNAASCKGIFPLIMENKLWYGPSISSGDREFRVPRHSPLVGASCRVDEFGNKFIRVNGVRWFTNMSHGKLPHRMSLYKLWSKNYAEYPKYDKYDAIEVSKTCDIPLGYKGAIGVPVTFLDKYCPDQFEILGMGSPTIDGVNLYKRIFIRFREGEGDEPNSTKGCSKA